MKKIYVNFANSFGKSDRDYFLGLLRNHYDVIVTDNPDFYFYSVMDYSYLKHDCVRIFYTGECYTPNFNECDYAIGFDRLSFGDRYCRIPIYLIPPYKDKFDLLKNRPQFTKEDLVRKTEFCNYVVSNSFVKDVRTDIFLKLSEYKRVNSGGRYLNNIGGAVKDKYSFQLKHKFSIAFENCSYDGYSTEKIVDAFAANTIPIYWGDPNIGIDFNTEAFINCHQFASLDDVIERVKEIDNNDDAYLEMMNAPILNNQKCELDDFLLHIFDQPLDFARRRPRSLHSIAQEKAKLRHRFFEEEVYSRIQFVKNQIYRMQNHTMLGRKRTK